MTRRPVDLFLNLLGFSTAWGDSTAQVVARLLPRRVVYWAMLRAGTEAVNRPGDMPDRTWVEVTEQWRRRR